MLIKLAGWKFYDDHPESGTMAYCNIRAVNKDGTEVSVWSGVVMGSAEYDISPDDDFSVEVTDDDGDLIEGEAFETVYNVERRFLEKILEYSE